MLPYGVVPPRQPIGKVVIGDKEYPVISSREWWRFWNNLFQTSGSGQGGGSGTDTLDDLFKLAYSELGQDNIQSKQDELALLTAPRPASDASNSYPATFLDGRPKGTDFERVTAELRELILLMRPPHEVNGATLGLGTMAFQNANAVAITGGTIDGTTIGATTPATGVFTTVNKVTITQPSASATLTLANGSTLATSGAFSTTFTATGATNLTLPTSGTVTALGNSTTGTGAIVLATGPTFASGGTVTMPDSATWSSSGLVINGTSYTARAVNIGPTVIWAATAGSGVQIGGSTQPAAGSTQYNGVNFNPNVSGGSNNLLNFNAAQILPSITNTYSGTITTVNGLRIGNLTNNSGVTVPNYNQIALNSNANGNGITSGTVVNGGLNVTVPTAAAGAGGAISNSAIIIQGNGGSGAGTTTNFAIDSTSTAPSTFAGPVADTAYSYQTPSTGFSITIGNLIATLILDPAATLATGTVTLPAAPIDGQRCRITSSQTITGLTLNASAGQTVKNAPTTLAVNLTGDQGYEFIYRAANTTWYRLQ